MVGKPGADPGDSQGGKMAFRKLAAWIGCIVGVTMALPAGAFANHSVYDLISIGPNGGNANINASFSGASSDGSSVFFRTDEGLVASDTDGAFDIYKRVGTTTTQ